MKLKHILSESILLERVSSVVYHATGFKGALKMLQSDFMRGELNTGHVSFTRSLQGSYHKENKLIGIIFEFDGDLLNRQYKGGPVGTEYFGWDDEPVEYGGKENRQLEDRVYTGSDRGIKNASKFIKHAIVYVPQEYLDTSDENEFEEPYSEELDVEGEVIKELDKKHISYNFVDSEKGLTQIRPGGKVLRAALKDFEPIGDFSKSSSFRNARDRKMITSPKFKEIVARKFSKTGYDINMYFVNSAKANRHTEVGAVDLDWVRENLGDEVADKVEPNYQEPSNVNIIFTNNKGAAGVAMTPWIMAHRMGHAFARFKSGGGGMRGMERQFRNYQEAVEAINNHFQLIMQDVYGIKSFNAKGDFGPRERRDQLLMKHLSHAIGTFKSARNRNLRDYFEVYNELFAQYLITGKVTFNELPKNFKAGRHSIGIRDEEAYDELKDLGSLERTLEYYFDEILSEAESYILVM